VWDGYPDDQAGYTYIRKASFFSDGRCQLFDYIGGEGALNFMHYVFDDSILYTVPDSMLFPVEGLLPLYYMHYWQSADSSFDPPLYIDKYPEYSIFKNAGNDSAFEMRFYDEDFSRIQWVLKWQKISDTAIDYESGQVRNAVSAATAGALIQNDEWGEPVCAGNISICQCTGDTIWFIRDGDLMRKSGGAAMEFLASGAGDARRITIDTAGNVWLTGADIMRYNGNSIDTVAMCGTPSAVTGNGEKYYAVPFYEFTSYSGYDYGLEGCMLRSTDESPSVMYCDRSNRVWYVGYRYNIGFFEGCTPHRLGYLDDKDVLLAEGNTGVIWCIGKNVSNHVSDMVSYAGARQVMYYDSAALEMKASDRVPAAITGIFHDLDFAIFDTGNHLLLGNSSALWIEDNGSYIMLTNMKPQEPIHGVSVDSDNRIWVATNKGLYDIGVY
jgi:hypothetical protein